jgi:hypothetical protein
MWINKGEIGKSGEKVSRRGAKAQFPCWCFEGAEVFSNGSPRLSEKLILPDLACKSKNQRNKRKHGKNMVHLAVMRPYKNNEYPPDHEQDGNKE